MRYANDLFLAEDDIRDLAVTEVQTCALPICRALDGAATRHRKSRRWPRKKRSAAPSGRPGRVPAAEDVAAENAPSPQDGRRDLRRTRSEERRVGTECKPRR